MNEPQFDVANVHDVLIHFPAEVDFTFVQVLSVTR